MESCNPNSSQLLRAAFRVGRRADGSAGGFDNVGEALHTSSFLLERYLEAADTALRFAVANLPRPTNKGLLLGDAAPLTGNLVEPNVVREVGQCRPGLG